MANPIKFASLSPSVQRRVALTMVRRAAHFSRGIYDLVDGPGQFVRPQSRIEFEGEDAALSGNRRARILNLARQGRRNGCALPAILEQFKLNVVGSVGGKATFDLPAAYSHDAAELRARFAEYCRSCEFFDGAPFGDTLSVIVEELLLGGDVVLLFDDNLVSDSGKVLCFESDEIGELSAVDFAARFPGYTQRQGRICDSLSRTCGVIVSPAQRGQTIFSDPSKCFILTRDPNASELDSSWVFLRNVFRFNQGRGVGEIVPPLGGILDLEATTAFEIQAAKHNAQTLGQIINQNPPPDEDELPEEFNPAGVSGADDPSAEDAAAEDAAETEGNSIVPSDAAGWKPPEVELNAIRSAGALFDVMPENTKMELLDTKRPNPNMPAFIDFLQGRSGAALGLARVYSTLHAETSYTAFRGEQVITWPKFEQLQKLIENHVCDWLVRRWASWALRHGLLDGVKLPADWSRHVMWTWPKMREVNPVDAQNAIGLKLRNHTTTYREELGPDWKERLAQSAEESRYLAELNLVDPSKITAAGAVVGAAQTEPQPAANGGKE